MIANFILMDCLNNSKKYEIKDITNLFIKKDYLIINTKKGICHEFALIKLLEFTLKGENNEKQ